MVLLARLPFFVIFAKGMGKIAKYIYVLPLQIFVPNFFWVKSCSSSLRVLPPSAILSVFLMSRGYSFSYSGP